MTIERFKFDGALTRSQYRNPGGSLLYQGTTHRGAVPDPHARSRSQL